MSSMWRVAVIPPLLLAIATSGSAQYVAPQQTQAARIYAAPSVTASISDWRRLRQSSGYSFADYARFLNANPDWPENSKLRRWAERAMRPGEHGPTVIAFFTSEKPRSGNGWTRLADAFASTGRMAEAMR